MKDISILHKYANQKLLMSFPSFRSSNLNGNGMKNIFSLKNVKYAKIEKFKTRLTSYCNGLDWVAALFHHEILYHNKRDPIEPLNSASGACTEISINHERIWNKKILHCL